MKNGTCPICNTESIKVKNITVRHLVTDDRIDFVGDLDYFLCINEECNIVYFNSNIRFNKNHVKVPIWFKKDADPKYVCYCSKVTEEQVITAVMEGSANNMKEVLNVTGAMTNPQCQIKNPLGKCCHQLIEAAIIKAKS